MSEVRVRIPPSPTGKMHLGTAYTALFNFLFARSQKGVFILRYEDTDQARSKKEFEENITESMKWLGLNWDEGPFWQMKRLDSYKAAIEKLISEKKAYYCFCTPEELDAERKLLAAQGKPQIYSGKCRNLSVEEVEKNKTEDKKYVIRFKMPEDRGKIEWDDLLHGKVRFEANLLGDMVIMRANGVPIYNFAVVLDDVDMKITHVLRGEDHLSNTPRQIVIYEALGEKLPYFAHWPNILNPDRIGKLSKREGATAVSDYEHDGYLPEAIVNYLASLGWTIPDDKEMISLQEMEQVFDLKEMRLSPAAFDMNKLDWFNGEYIRAMSDEELTKRLQNYLVDHPNKDKIAPIVPLIKERIKKLSDFIPLTDFLFEKPEYDMGVFNKLKIADLKIVLEKISEKFVSLERPWTSGIFQNEFMKLAKELNLSNLEMFQLIRVSVSGQAVSPPLFESIQLLGEDETINRIEEAKKFIENPPAEPKY